MSFQLVSKSVTLNGVMAPIVLYFTKFVYDVAVKNSSRSQSHLLTSFLYIVL